MFYAKNVTKLPNLTVLGSSTYVPNIEVGRCLGPKGSGDISRGGNEGGLGPPGVKGEKQSAPYKGDKQPAVTNGDKHPAPNKGDGQLTPNEEGGNIYKEEEEKKSQA